MSSEQRETISGFLAEGRQVQMDSFVGCGVEGISDPAFWGLRDFSVTPLSLVSPQFISLTRPLDSHLEHVDFSSLLHCLSFEQILQIFASAVLERRIIFLAEGLRRVQPWNRRPSSNAREHTAGFSKEIRL